MLTLDQFEPLLGEQFVLQDHASGAICAALIEARRLAGPASGGRLPFALLFEGPPDPLLAQCIYRASHPVFEALDLFLVPVGRGRSGMQYEAVFN